MIHGILFSFYGNCRDKFKPWFASIDTLIYKIDMSHKIDIIPITHMHKLRYIYTFDKTRISVWWYVGLEAQLLGIVVRKERPELEEQKDNLVINIAAGKKKLEDLEDQILR